jgi:SAM-dependent methyltransferase
MESESDPRHAIYRAFQANQHGPEIPQLRASAGKIFTILFEYARPASVLDVGCGFGPWLSTAREMGVAEVRGIEGPWIDRTQLLIEPESVEVLDLERGFSLGRRTFDLVICSEVAEHLSPDAAPRLIKSLADHGDLILFSAAIPFQGGEHHVNEQFPDYWAVLFAAHGFLPLDFIRPQIWSDESILWWLRQNLLLFAHERALSKHPPLRKHSPPLHPLSIVLPDFYLSRAQSLLESASVMKILSEPGTFAVVPAGDGKMTIRRISNPSPGVT